VIINDWSERIVECYWQLITATDRPLERPQPLCDCVLVIRIFYSRRTAMDENHSSRSQKMGVVGATSYIIGNIVGSGIFITPTAILQTTGSIGLSLVIWVAAACISTLGSFCYVELGTSIRMSGGDFAYMCFMKWFALCHTIKYPIAFAFMCIGCSINYPATLAVQAQTFAEYMFQGIGIDLDPISSFWSKKLLGFALMWLLLFMNFFSLKTFVSRFQIAASIAKFASTGLVIVTGFYMLIFQGETNNLQNPFFGSNLNIGAIVSALFTCLFSYDGWDILNFGAEEIDKPKRTMPMAIIIGMLCVALIFIAVNMSYFVVLSTSQILSSEAVAMTFAEVTLGKGDFVMPIFVAVLLIGSLNSTMFSASRYLQAASKQGRLPTFISGINPTTDSPRTALSIHVRFRVSISDKNVVQLFDLVIRLLLAMYSGFGLDPLCHGYVFCRRSRQSHLVRSIRTVVPTCLHHGSIDLDSIQV
ncbi:hypothetical protein Angca_007285, partial [Angiostrongylus cantonensis]